MPDREKVMKGLTAHMNGNCNTDDCPWYDCDDDGCIKSMFDATLELLKEQEAVEPTVGGITEHDGHGSWWYQCGKCKMPIDYGDKFCKRCGQEVKWDAAD